MRVAVVDIGTNSTRLLIADVTDGAITEHERRSTVTRLGEGVDANGRLGDEPVVRVLKVLDEYADAIEASACDARVGVLTSAVRDADNGPEFTAQVRDRYGIDASTIDGDTEAQLTFRGATSGRDAADDRPLLVLDIGGGSTEFVVGARGEVAFHVSTQLGVVRQSERHLGTDPPAHHELADLAGEVRATIAGAIPADVRKQTVAAVAVAGTATTAAAIGLELDPYDPQLVEGHGLTLGFLELLLARLAALHEAERRHVVGLHPDRAPTIVAGITILIEALRAFGLESVEVSEHDILYGAALERAAS